MSVQTAPSRASFVGFQGQTAARGRRVHDLHDPDPARELRADRPFRRARSPIRPITSPCTWPGPELGGLRHDYRRPEASLRRQVHARRRPLRADVLRAVDDHGRSPVPEVQGDRRQEVLRGAEGRLPRDRRARLPPRRRRAQDAAVRTRGSPDDPLFAEAKEGGRGIHALSGHIESIDQSNDVNGGPSGVGLAIGRRQGRVLGHGRRADQSARR